MLYTVKLAEGTDMALGGPRPDEAILARGLVKTYDRERALGGFDLRVPRGVVWGLLGPNGAARPPPSAHWRPCLRCRRARRGSPVSTCDSIRRACGSASDCPDRPQPSTRSSAADRTSSSSGGSGDWAGATQRPEPTSCSSAS